jgi:hypothetical protein
MGDGGYVLGLDSNGNFWQGRVVTEWDKNGDWQPELRWFHQVKEVQPKHGPAT